MKSFLFGTLLTLILFTTCQPDQLNITWISSSPGNVWQTKEVDLLSGAGSIDDTIMIFSNKKQQVIDGFGGCFNELGWEALNILSLEEQDKILYALFDTTDGCKFSLCRMPMGANDYAVDWYSHNESKDDFKMEHFSIDRDKERLIPYIRKARLINPGIKIWASPWCPPSWMKTNNHYACRPDEVNDLEESGRGEEMKDQFIMKEEYLSAYALYFSRFLHSYAAEDIPLYAVHVQNEPNSCQNFPSCVWTPSSLAKFIGVYLGPQFEKDQISTEIWLGTVERPQIERVDTILTDAQAQQYIKGVGFQWAGKGAIPQVHIKYPQLKLMQTETECGDGSNDWPAAQYTFNLMKHYFKHGANAYLYWNMVLDETGKSQWGWKQNAMITVNSETKEVTYNPEFYLMKHFSHFIHPGAQKIESSDENCLAFKNSDSVVIIYFNKGNSTQKQFSLDGVNFTAQLAENSYNTFKISI